MSQGNEELNLSIRDVEAHPLPGNVYEIKMNTNRGDVNAILHPAEGSLGAVIWVGGASGGMNGPAGGLFANLSQDLVNKGITSLRLQYRFPDVLEECVLDVLGGVSLLHGLGARKIALVGHSFGGAVVITAGALSPNVSTVVALSSQSVGTHLADRISPRPLLLIHGMADNQVTTSSSRDIMERAGEPKQLVILEGGGHDLLACEKEVHRLVGEWLVDQVGNGEYVAPTEDVTPANVSFKVFPSKAGNGSGPIGRDLMIADDDITNVKVDAIVNPTSEELWLIGAVGEAIRRRGGYSIEEEVVQYAPAQLGSAVVSSGGPLRAKHIIHAVVAGGMGSFTVVTPEILSEATKNCLLKAEELGLKSIAFPALGTGGGGLPYEKAAEVMIGTIINHLRGATGLHDVRIIVSGAGAFRAFGARLQYFAEIDQGGRG